MACGAPVVVSSGNSLEEIVGGAGPCVDPLDIGALAQAMDRILLDEEFAQECRSRSLERAREFSWERCARSVVGLIEGLA